MEFKIKILESRHTKGGERKDPKHVRGLLITQRQLDYSKQQIVNNKYFNANYIRLGSSSLIRMPLFISVYIDLYANSKT